MILEFRKSRDNLHLLRNSSLKLENLLNNHIWCSSLEMLKQSKSSSGVIAIWQILRLIVWWCKDKIRSTRITGIIIKQMAKRKFGYWRRFRTLVSWQQERYVPERVWWSVTRVSIFACSYRGIFDELEVEGFLREKIVKCSDRIS